MSFQLLNEKNGRLTGLLLKKGPKIMLNMDPMNPLLGLLDGLLMNTLGLLEGGLKMVGGGL